MPDYPNYKVNAVPISNILEYSENRTNISPFAGYKYENKEMTFASFISNYHPFSYNTGINNYFANKTTFINKGCAAKGFAPLLNTRFETTNNDGNKEVVIQFCGTGNPLGVGFLRIVKDNVVTTARCPTCVIIGVIGAGGGGAGGGGWWTPKESFGGGSAALVALHIEMPFYMTNFVDVLRVRLGSGGNGGNAWKNGSSGSETTVDFFSEGEWHRIAYIDGGKGGENLPKNRSWIPTTDPAISVAYINTVDKYIFGKQGNGRITIVNSVRQWSTGITGAHPYLPGNYYSDSKDDRYDQATAFFGPLTSGDSTYSQYIHSYSGSAQGTRRGNVWHSGKYSVYGVGGNVGNSSGGNGGIGAGGGAGASSANIFDSGIGKGGKGGSAGLKIYW